MVIFLCNFLGYIMLLILLHLILRITFRCISGWVCCCCLVAKSCLTLCDPMDCITPCFPVLHHFLSLLKFMSVELVMQSNHINLCDPLLLLPSIFPSIPVIAVTKFNIADSNESALLIRWPKY